ncbi:MAG: immunoglobulin domain-containing protein, partial [Verrucomicrobiota bacterium]
WFYQEFNDPEPGWLFPDFFGNDTWQGGAGFFSVGFEEGVYPVETGVPLAGGRTTYYFRTPFLWEHAAEGVALIADAHFSDGAVLYLNGEEVRRIRMPEGEVDGSTEATSSQPSPGEIETFSLPAGALITGENLLMVEMHQAAESPNSLAFGLSLRASDRVPPRFEEPDKPADREVTEGESTIFELGSLAGTEPYDFQWYKDGVAIEEAVGARLEIPVVLVNDAGTYAVEVSNASGRVRSRDVILTTTALPVSFSDETQPADQVLVEGEVLTLGIGVEGSPEFTYQWYRDEVALVGATEETLTLDPASVEDSGDYHVTVTNRLNSLTSRKARIEVQSDAVAPAIDTLKAGSTTLAMTFSEIVDRATAGEISHYSIPGVSVLGVTVGEDLRTVTLETGPVSFGQEYRVRVDGVEDRFGNRATLQKAFRATIIIDGDFGYWQGIEPVATEPRDAAGFEFHHFWVANDEEFLYLRFSFHENIGQLPVDYFYQIFIDGDNDPTTGLSMSNLGSSLIIENGSGWLQVGGGFNEGSVSNVDFQLAPESASQEFECRISLASQKEGVRIFEAEAIGITFNLVSTSWEAIESGPTESIFYTLTDLPPLVDPETPTGRAPFITIRRSNQQVEITWDKGSLESSETMRAGSWVPVSEATSPYVIRPDGAARYYRSME